jgi:hypothetical protein
MARVQALFDRDDHRDFENDTEVGVCIECGNEQAGVRSDAERERCETCGKPGLFAITQLFCRMTGW